MNYWPDLFTGTTWDEFRKSGATISRFRHRMRNAATKVRPADIFLCYVTGIMPWLDAMEVGRPTSEESNVRAVESFPVRIEVNPLILLAAALAELTDHN